MTNYFSGDFHRKFVKFCTKLSELLKNNGILFLLKKIRKNGVKRQDWSQKKFLLASLLPLGQAVQSTGTAEWLAYQVLLLLEGCPVWGLQAVIALLATVFTLVMSNVGATVLLVPLAVSIALAAGGDPAIFAMTVDDAYAVFATARGFDPSDAYSKHFKHENLTRHPMPVRIGVPDSATIKFYGDKIQQDAFDRDIAILAESGATIIYVNFSPFYAIAEMLYEGAWVAERYTVIENLLKKKLSPLFALSPNPNLFFGGVEKHIS